MMRSYRDVPMSSVVNSKESKESKEGDPGWKVGCVVKLERVGAIFLLPDRFHSPMCCSI
jgi:hypothetical protein